MNTIQRESPRQGVSKNVNPNSLKYIGYLILLLGFFILILWVCNHYDLVLIAIQQGQDV